MFVFVSLPWGTSAPWEKSLLSMIFISAYHHTRQAHGRFSVKILSEWSVCVCVCVCVCCAQFCLFSTPWTVACQAPLSMGFFRQEYWTGLPFSPPRDFSNSGIKPMPSASSALASRFFTTELSGKPEVNAQTETNIYMPLWWHHRLDRHMFEWTPGVGDGQGGLACCDSWGRKESDTNERRNWTDVCLDINKCLYISYNYISLSL